MISGAARTFSSDSHADRFSAHARGKLGGAVERAIHDAQLPMPRLRRCSTTCSATAPAPTISAARPLRLPKTRSASFTPASATDMGRAPTSVSDAHALPHFERALKRAIEHRAGGAVFERLAVGGAKLAENFRFAEQHRIESRGNAEEMAHGVGARSSDRVRPSSSARAMPWNEVRKSSIASVTGAAAAPATP